MIRRPPRSTLFPYTTLFRSPDPRRELADAGREFYRRGWVLGTSGNFSMLMARNPLRMCVTASGMEKGKLDETNFLDLDDDAEILDRKSTRLNSSHANISYAV